MAIFHAKKKSKKNPGVWIFAGVNILRKGVNFTDTIFSSNKNSTDTMLNNFNQFLFPCINFATVYCSSSEFEET